MDENHIEKKCPKCGAQFICEHSASCWCSEYSLSDQAKKIISSEYSDCLCPTCLKGYTSIK